MPSLMPPVVVPGPVGPRAQGDHGGSGSLHPWEPSGGRSIQISVRDEGLGVPAEARKRIFEPYAAAAGTHSTTGYESFGLGLSFCKLAAEAQGGVIRIEDGVPRGSVFTVELPR